MNDLILRRPGSGPRTLASALLVALVGGCTVLDLPDPPTFELNDNDRACRVDTDCAGVEIVSQRGTLLADSDPDGDTGPLPQCLEVSVICNTDHNVCEAEVRVRDADGDEAFDPICAGFEFAPFVEDCDDSNPDVTQRDADGDGQVSTLCVRDPGPDCDDTRPTVLSGAPVEICDGFVSDCDAWVDGVSPARPEEDADGDLVAPPGADCEAGASGARDAPGGFPKTDCDDANPFVFPGAPEVCDGLINDCGTGMGPRANEDADGDGFGAPDGDCVESEAFPKTDCDDDDPATYPGAPEICDRITNDCNMPREPRLVEDADGDGLASFDAPCAAGPIPFGDCINGADSDPTSRYCAFLERFPGLDETLTSAAGVTFLDYDDDGLGDIVAGSSGPGTLRLFRQNPVGQFTHVPAFNLSASVSALRSGRLFDDARSDVVVVRPSGTVEVACNQGSLAAPAAATIVSGFSGARDAAVVRLSDAQRAVVAVSPILPTLQVAARTSVAMRCAVPSDFTVTPLALGSNAIAVAAGRLLSRATDVEDVVVVTVGGDVLLLANAPAAFGGLTLQPSPIATGLTGALSAAVGDFDGDGRLDIAVGTETGPRFLRNTNEAVDGFVVSTVATAPTNVVAVHSSDINLDGRDDLITVSSANDSIDWWELVGSTWVRHSLVSDFNEASAATTGDVDGDGDLDVIGVAAGADLLTWWATEVASATSFARSKVDRAFDGALAVVAADLDADGRQDIVGLGTNNLSRWTVQGSASAPVYTEFPLEEVSGGRALAAGDLNQDGATDLVVSDDGGVRVFIRRSDGSGFNELGTANGLGTSGLGVVYLALGDVSGDGVPDIVGVTTTSVFLWTNPGNGGSMFTRATVGTVAVANAVAVGDTDGDGLLDIVVSTTSPDMMPVPGVHVFSRASVTEEFTTTTLMDSFPAEHVTVGDIDGDGRAEIFAGASRLNALVSSWAWDGSAYRQHVLSTAFEATWTHRMQLTDVDSDGDLDVLVAFAVDPINSIGWFENINDSDAGWVLHAVTSSSAAGDSMATADFDGDGDLDIVVAHGLDSEVVLYKNDGVAWWRPAGR
ncbi:MAG: FG-GAP-like repeat-containing protein [Polyangiales bacterium]